MLGRGIRARTIIALGIAVTVACHADVGPKTESAAGKPPPVVVALRTRSITLGVGESFQLALDCDVPGAVEWRSAAPGVVGVSADGLVTALAPGRGEVIVRSAGSADTADVRVHAPLARIEIPEDTLELAVDKAAQLEFRALGAGGGPADSLALHDLAWASSRPAVARVDAGGHVVAIAIGTTDVAVTAGSVADTVTIRVVETPVAQLAIDPVRTPLVVGGVDTLRATAWDARGRHLARRIVTWSSGDPTVAALTPIAAGGLLSALRPGTTTITASSEGRADVVAIRVDAPAIEVSAELPRVFLRTRVEDTPSRGRALHVQAESAFARTGAGPFGGPPDQ